MRRRLLPLAVALLAFAAHSVCRAQAFTGATDHRDSRVDIYGGYSWFHPINSGIGGKAYQDIDNPAATISISYFFNRYIGAQIEGGYFSGEGEHKLYDPNCSYNCDQIVYTAEGGPVFRYPIGPFVPFLHTLVGGERYNGPVDNPLKWGWGVTGGIGVDYVLPWFNQHIAIRPIQADWQYSQVVYGPLLLPADVLGGFGEISAVKLSGGVVLRLGDTYSKPAQLALGCTAQPAEIFAGDPVTVTSSTIGLNEHRRADYLWQSNGGSVRPQGSEATVDTTGLQPGQYTVVGHLSQGMKAREQASCQALFTVRELLPPTVSCSANPSTAASGQMVTISAMGTSPENRPLTYSFGTTGGSVLPSGTLATLDTQGVPPGSTITVSCNAVDDEGQHASSTADVLITGAMPVMEGGAVLGNNTVAPLGNNTVGPLGNNAMGSLENNEAATQTLCSLSFERDRRRPTRVDNEAKACLDDIALAMGHQLDAQLVMVGHASRTESSRSASERLANARHYLVTDHGIDPARISLRVGDHSGRRVDDILVPAGSIYEDPTSSVYRTPSAARPSTHRRQTNSNPFTRSMSGVSHPPANPGP